MAQRFTRKKRSNTWHAVRYRDESWRFAAAFVAAVATGLASYPRDVQGEAAVNFFLGLVAVYFFIAYVALLWMRVCTALLDRRFPWPDFPSSRLVFQLFCAWLLPILLVYALAHSVLSLPQLAPLARGNADSRETAAVLVLSLALSCNIAYACAYFIALSKRLQRKARKGLRLVGELRASQHAYRMEMEELKRALLERNGDGAWDESAMEEGPAAQKKTRILPDNPTDGQYRHLTLLRTEMIAYRDISEFELIQGTVFIIRIGVDKEAVKQRSLTAIEDITGGYFRKIGRTRAIAHHLLKRCVQRGNFLELTLWPHDEVVLVSDDYTRQVTGWVLGRISIERDIKEAK